jgi:hypothetical protein
MGGMELCVSNQSLSGWEDNCQKLFLFLSRLPYVCEDVALEVPLLLFVALRFFKFSLIGIAMSGVFEFCTARKGQIYLASQADL